MLRNNKEEKGTVKPEKISIILIENHIVDKILQGLQYDFQLYPNTNSLSSYRQNFIGSIR